MPRGFRKKEPRDYLNNLIEVGDQYFYGAPPTLGTVVAIKGSTIIIESGIYGDRDNPPQQMKCKSPEKGLCIDKT